MASTVKIAILADASKAKAELAATSAAAGQMQARLSHAGAVAGTALKVGAAAGTAGLLAMARAGIKTASDMEQASISFTTMLGSGAKAKAFLGQLNTFAAQTPFDFAGLRSASSSLISAGVDAGKVIPIMRTLGDVTSGMGTGAEGIQRATVAIQQMQAAQKISGEDLNQLRDAGVPVYDLLAAATGRSKAEVVKLAQAGKLGKKELDQLMAALQSGKGLERFSGLMAKQSQSLAGLWSTVKDNVAQGLAKAFEPAVPALKSILDMVGGRLPAAFAALTKLTTQIFNPANMATFKSALDGVGKAFDLAKSAASDLMAVLANPAFQVFAAGVGTVVAGLKIYSITMTVIRAATAAWAAAQAILNIALTANPIGLIVLAIAAFVAMLVVAYQRSETFRAIVQAGWAGIKIAVAAVVSWFTTTVPQIWQSAVAAFQGAKAAAVGAMNAVQAKVTGAMNSAKAAFNSAKTSASNAFNSAKTAIINAVTGALNFITSLPGKVTAAFGNAGSLLSGAGSKVISGFIDGITSKFGAVRDTLSRLTSMLPDWKGPAKKDATILEKSGQLVISGFVGGLESQYPKVFKSLQRLTGNLRKFGGNKNVKTAITGWADKIMEQVSKIRQDRLDALAKLIDERDAWAKQLADAAQGGGIMGAVGQGRTNADAITRGLEAQLKAVNDYRAKLAKLVGRGVKGTLLQELYTAGVDGGSAMVDGLLGASTAALERIKSLRTQVEQAGAALGKQGGNDIYGAQVAAAQAKTREPVVIELNSGGSKMDDLLVELLRQAIRKRGGNVQVVLGKR